MRKQLGKIQAATFGFVGYQDAEFGLALTLGDGSWGVQKLISGGWSLSVKPTEFTKWTDEDRDRHIARLGREVQMLMLAAKVSDIKDLVGIPVEVEFEGNQMTSFRVLTEVL